MFSSVKKNEYKVLERKQNNSKENEVSNTLENGVGEVRKNRTNK